VKKPFLVCVFAIILLPACAWLRGDPSVDDRFTTEDLEDGGLGIGGVVVTSDRIDELVGKAVDEAELANLLRTQIIEARQDFKVVSTGYIERMIGEDLGTTQRQRVSPSTRPPLANSRKAVLESYRLNRSLRPEVLVDIAPQLGERFRFLVFANIHGDTVSTRARALDQKPGDDGPSTDYITHRQIAATFHVYDLEEVVLVRVMHLYANAERTINRNYEPGTPGTLPASLYPDPIGLHAVAAFLFEDFVTQLPGAARADK
jgi:hypothetical protein